MDTVPPTPVRAHRTACILAPDRSRPGGVRCGVEPPSCQHLAHGDLWDRLCKRVLRRCRQVPVDPEGEAAPVIALDPPRTGVPHRECTILAVPASPYRLR
jgi:hypothetical protein